jgi:hypothetical protein
MHYSLQTRLNGNARDALSAARGSLTRAPELLAPFDLDADTARLTAALYLAELAVRLVADDQAGAGSRLGAVDQWLLPALNVGVAAL